MNSLSSVDELKILNVSELWEAVKDTFLGSYTGIRIRGEISQIKAFGAGHAYPTLKDEKSQISCALFKGVRQSLKFELEEGLKVVAFGRLDVYAPRGSCQFIIQSLEPDGMGALQLAFEQLKAKLALKGYFDPSQKKPLPYLPQKVALITSWHGAVLHDFIVTLLARFNTLDIVILPVLVQGDKASFEIAEALQYASKERLADVVVLARGGGSLEDLWPFNEERVVEAIRQSEIPVVSAIGHEVDFTLADFAADLRAATPTAAVHHIVPDKKILQQKILDLKVRLVLALKQKLENQTQHLKMLKRCLKSPADLWQQKQQEFLKFKDKLTLLKSKILDERIQKIQEAQMKLRLLSPYAVLDRGFVMVHNAKGACETSSQEIKVGSALLLTFKDGLLNVEVKGRP